LLNTGRNSRMYKTTNKCVHKTQTYTIRYDMQRNLTCVQNRTEAS